ncbi:MAG TPA: GNAT family N-acetyltransferase [Candidatus Limnocylindrales bacterium]|nr:GNAT family N-acetyltransferase [Candidatus Limnocylindrales bacterium]
MERNDARARALVTIRPIRPDDAPALERFYERLSDDSRHLRFFAVTRGLSHAQSASFCSTDHDHRDGFVATIAGVGDNGVDRVGAGAEPAGSGDRGEAENGETIVGHVCLEPIAPGRAEVAIAVADALQGHGIGRRLMVAAFDWARWAGVDALVATTLAENVGIRRLMASLGVPLHERPIGVDAAAVELIVPPGHVVAA